MEEDFKHDTVMQKETIESVLPSSELMQGWKRSQDSAKQSHFRLVDCTFGGGGHSLALIRKMFEDGYLRQCNLHLIGFDRDPTAIAHGNKILLQLSNEIQHFSYQLINSRFSTMAEAISNEPIDALIADLGVSSPQLDIGERGFSLKNNGPLDMRMNPTAGNTALEILLSSSESTLSSIFAEYGEEPRARKLARAICDDRQRSKLPTTSLEFAEYCARILGYHNSRIHPATRIFQALRIAVNEEIAELHDLLCQLPNHISPYGKVAFISFHSLEDRAVKQAMRAWQNGHHYHPNASPKTEPIAPNFPHLEPKSWGRELPRGGIVPNAKEQHSNPRSRSARLRIFCFNNQHLYCSCRGVPKNPNL